ncbi:MAG: ABC transporter permease [Candidatus Limnocylindrales bacterium]
MEFLTEAISWFLDPANWSGRDGIPVRVGQHVSLSFVSIIIAVAIALPVGLILGHARRAEGVVIGFANLGRALPSLAILLIFLPVVGIGDPLVVVAMVVLAIPPILVNAAVAVREVDRELVEAARGMGMSGVQVLRRVEIPVGLPLIFTGIRVAAVQVVATLTLGALVAGGGLGRFIVDGLALRDNGKLVAGALLVALLAVATERVFSLLERRATLPGSGPRALALADLASPSAQPMVP